MKKTKQIIPYPFPVYFWVIMSIAVVGLMDAVYLSISHYRVYTDMTYRSFCAVTKSINCDTVSQSPFAVMLGMPLAVWAIFGYALVILIMGLAKSKTDDNKHLWPLIFFISTVFSLHSLILAYISTFIIHSYCLMCILSYCVNFLLMFYSWLIHKRFHHEGLLAGLKKDLLFLGAKPLRYISLMVLFSLCLIMTWVSFPNYWIFEPPDPSIEIPMGISPEGDPWIGAPDPELTIVEFTDYRCFQCRKMHQFLRHIVAQHPDKLRLVHKHFPMDHAFNPLVKSALHVGAGRLALLAIYAAKNSKFWEMNDILLDLGKDINQINMKTLAEKCDLNGKGLPGSLMQPSILSKLATDIREGLRLGIEGTPGYYINGKVYTGQIPADILKPYL